MRSFITILILGATCFLNSSYAQPVITGLTAAPLGTMSKGYNIPGTIVPGVAGANQTWDYSAIPHDTASYYFKSVDYAGLSQAIKDSFPTANTANELYMNGNFTATLLYKITATEFVYLGLNNTPFAVPDTQLVFPHSYLETHVGFTYDAYGTLKTPFGTYNDVVRLRETVGSNHKYDYWQFTPVYTILMEYFVDTVTQAITQKAFFNTNAVTSVQDRNENNKFSLYPNPATGDLFIQTNITGIAKAEIFDIVGRVVLQSDIIFQGNAACKLDIAGLQAGTYFVNLTAGTKTYTQKLLIQ